MIVSCCAVSILLEGCGGGGDALLGCSFNEDPSVLVLKVYIGGASNFPETPLSLN